MLLGIQNNLPPLTVLSNEQVEEIHHINILKSKNSQRFLNKLGHHLLFPLDLDVSHPF